MVFVLDKHQKPLMPCSEKRARLLLERRRAVIHQMAPFTIRLKDRRVEDSVLQDLRLKLDPGSKTTGAALILEGTSGFKVIFLGEIVHKPGIKIRLKKRQDHRRGRRFRHTRYRPARFQNRRRPPGWLPPSLEARVDQTLHAVAKIRTRAPITALSVEHVRFDTQKMQDPEIRGVEYQQGTLLGYEVREYLLDKWDRHCAYCDTSQVDFQIDHVYPKDLGGSDRVSNLALACPACNQNKDNRLLADFLANDKGRRQRARKNARAIAGKDRAQQQKRAQWEATRLERIQRQIKAPLKDAAAMNATRWRLYDQLKAIGLAVEGGSGGRTKMQRIQHKLPKEHYYDALCVGISTPDQFTRLPAYVAVWAAKGRGTRQLCGTDKYGFPNRHRSRRRQHFGFHTGDLIQAIIPRGKYTGPWTGRVSVRASGSFDISAEGRRVAQGVSHQHCRVLQRQDGWQYEQKPRAVS